MSPSKYKPEYCKKIVEFFKRPPYRKQVTPVYDRDGNVTKELNTVVCNDLPFLSEFAHTIGVCLRTLERWEKNHAEFGEAWQMAKDLQKNFLITNGLRGLYNPTFAIFTAKNITDMRDQTEAKVQFEGEFGCIILPMGGRHGRETQSKKRKEGKTRKAKG